MQLKLNTRNVNGVTVVDCNGRIVFGEESALIRDTLKQLIKENSQIVLNLSGISYIDSGGRVRWWLCTRQRKTPMVR